jgi:hypothetical protein
MDAAHAMIFVALVFILDVVSKLNKRKLAQRAALKILVC